MEFRPVLRKFGRGALKLGLIAIVAVAVAILILSYAPNRARSFLAFRGKIVEFASALLAPPLVAERPQKGCAWLDQNWSAADRAWFHNASQGTATFPVSYGWFQKLERPEISPFDLFVRRGLISDPDYLGRLGFMAPRDCDPKAGSDKPEGYGVLPVGFAVLKGRIDPTTGVKFEDGLGLTCAACHTGHIFYKGFELRIDGAQAMIDLQNLERIIGLSVCYTAKAPWRKARFADAVLDTDPAKGRPSYPAREAIATGIKDICDNEVFGKVTAERNILARQHMVHTEEGFGRLDALNRIGNQVFHDNLADPLKPEEPAVKEREGGLSQAAMDANFAAHTAPVSFPPIWDVPNFSWAQYDASILNPDIRNIGEAMGVTAKINMTNPQRPLFASTVHVAEIARIESMLQGRRHLDGMPTGFDGPPEPLAAPRWEDAAKKLKGMKGWDDQDDKAWTIDAGKVAEGRKLYRQFCFECHRAPLRDPGISADDPDSFWREKNSDQADSQSNDNNWVRIGKDTKEWLFNVVQKPVAHMGTDPEQARVLTERQVSVPDYLGLDPAADILQRCGLKPTAALKKSYAVNLMAAVGRTEAQWAKDPRRADGSAMSAQEVETISSSRPNCPNPKVFNPVQPVGEKDTASITYLATPRYRARPLDGVWATAPYLHNGSVPTLDDLLRPQADRPQAFCVGPLEFDPERVGLPVPAATRLADVTCEAGLTRFDASQRGNSNLGHSFEGLPEKSPPAGVLGRQLLNRERSALIEYLKTL
ncbi:di-heme-cytochrome C peroxidase [Mesorhizobium sp. B2-3-4]|uniref:di-heme-cytochrome C peroxidase n=1 Tax=Mesorhizobium sp. B2-3-4 TaxID=2589959 RepID=UPI00112A0C56|nr:di-heme-cytochrome C peroxidase [Mesorhizobium sp. B2-3-4]TPM37830.1 cytochrome C [Mesorhizobium sp. B2-3-4]